MEFKPILLEPPVTRAICSHLTFVDAWSFRDALNLPTLNYPISLVDRQTSKTLNLPGINSSTISVYFLILRHGLNGTWIAASSRNRVDILKILLENRLDVESRDPDGETPLTWAADSGSNKVIKTLLEKNANIEASNQNGQTALMLASRNGYIQTVKILLEHGANVQTATPNGKTALNYASKHGHSQIIELLKAAGAS